jgi:hypothetical protein
MLPNSNQSSNVTKVFSKTFHNLIWRFLYQEKTRGIIAFYLYFFPVWRNIAPPEKEKEKAATDL